MQLSSTSCTVLVSSSDRSGQFLKVFSISRSICGSMFDRQAKQPEERSKREVERGNLGISRSRMAAALRLPVRDTLSLDGGQFFAQRLARACAVSSAKDWVVHLILNPSPPSFRFLHRSILPVRTRLSLLSCNGTQRKGNKQTPSLCVRKRAFSNQKEGSSPPRCCIVSVVGPKRTALCQVPLSHSPPASTTSPTPHSAPASLRG